MHMPKNSVYGFFIKFLKFLIDVTFKRNILIFCLIKNAIHNNIIK